MENLNNLTISDTYTDCSYSEAIILRDGNYAGKVDTQYSYVLLDGSEYRGVKKDDPMYQLVIDAIEMFVNRDEKKVEKKEEVIVPDRQSNRQFGFCPKCETYCYGDCESN